MNRFLKGLAKFALYSFFLLAGAVYGLLAVFAGGEPITAWIKGSKNHCEGDLKSEYTYVKFAEQDLYLPSRNIHDCYPVYFENSWDIDQAYLSLIGKFPDFSPVDYQPERTLSRKDELRISFTGGKHDPKSMDLPLEGTREKLNEVYQYRLDLKVNGVKRYKEPKDTPFGLTYYEINHTSPYLLDMYVHKTKNGDIDYMVECYNSKKLPKQYLPTCNSVSQWLYPNVSYNLHFALDRLPDYKKIDALLNPIARKVKEPQPVIGTK